MLSVGIIHDGCLILCLILCRPVDDEDDENEGDGDDVAFCHP